VTVFFPDVSNDNWGNTELTDEGQQNLYDFLGQLRSAGMVAVQHKMSQGSGYVDPYGALCQKWCSQNSFPFLGGYHYATADPPAGQVNNWLIARGGKNVEIDFEGLDDNGNPNLNMGQFWDLVYAFNAADINVAAAYFPQWYADDIGADLSQFAGSEIALHSSAYPMGDSMGPPSDLYRACGGDTGEGFSPYLGSQDPAVWQFTESARIGGFVVDCNAFKGSAVALPKVYGQ
jgi:lysozyme